MSTRVLGNIERPFFTELMKLKYVNEYENKLQTIKGVKSFSSKILF